MSFAQEFVRRSCYRSDIVDHLPRLFDETCRYPGAVVIELGVRSGNSTAAFLHAAELVGGHVWSVDIDTPAVPDWWFESDLWSVVVGDDLKPDTFTQLPDECDVLFIDTSHSFAHTYAELVTYSPRLKPGGVILMHDTELEQPDAVGPQPPFPVRKAIEEFIDGLDFEAEFVSGCFGLGVLRRV